MYPSSNGSQGIEWSLKIDGSQQIFGKSQNLSVSN